MKRLDIELNERRSLIVVFKLYNIIGNHILNYQDSKKALRASLWRQKCISSGLRTYERYLNKWSPIIFEVSLEKNNIHIYSNSFVQAKRVDKNLGSIEYVLKSILPIEKWKRYKKRLQSKLLFKSNSYRLLEPLESLYVNEEDSVYILGFPIQRALGTLWVLLSFNLKNKKEIFREIRLVESSIKSLSRWLESIDQREHFNDVLEKHKVLNQLEGQENLQHFIVHQIKSPIIIAQHFLELFQLESHKKSKQIFLENIENTSFALSKLKNSINEYLNIIKNKENFKIHSISLEDLWKQVGDVYKNDRGIRVKLPLSSSPTKETIVKIKGNIAQCFMIFESLIENAREANDKEICVQIEGEIKKEKYVICVRDSGVGISLDCVEKVFDPFYGSNRGGHGLGLFFCRQSLNKMGATIQYIWSESMIQRGFEICFDYISSVDEYPENKEGK